MSKGWAQIIGSHETRCKQCDPMMWAHSGVLVQTQAQVTFYSNLIIIIFLPSLFLYKSI